MENATVYLSASTTDPGTDPGSPRKQKPKRQIGNSPLRVSLLPTVHSCYAPKGFSKGLLPAHYKGTNGHNNIYPLKISAR